MRALMLVLVALTACGCSQRYEASRGLKEVYESINSISSGKFDDGLVAIKKAGADNLGDLSLWNGRLNGKVAEWDIRKDVSGIYVNKGHLRIRKENGVFTVSKPTELGEAFILRHLGLASNKASKRSPLRGPL